ncbi:fatty acid desaturase family protein [Gymnodinialimonas ceratoperidinii]|uniref:Fatty acid desaturase family protein n=1 Tax=Gymnodinialimonas ceratoperidinii TaxID=2856823 RepID=A0A8F6TU46_9RHOB|nr:fatty acid desaturase family protein [Gymnodinialimonas ceratoperidinii]QXT38996.1 fatty acid desaturase family protein [Gymnodinialimonas ceratoperidinii]
MRDYSLNGTESARAVELGLASAEWYHSEVPRKVMKGLMRRSDAPATRDTVLWIGLMVVTALAGVLTWGTWWCVPFFAVYGVLYGSACDSRWHECGHGTAFKTQWKNDWVYILASFMVMRNPVAWRWSHARHHTDTIIVGRDPEIAMMRPPDIARKALAFIGIPDVFQHFAILVRQALGQVNGDEADYIPESEVPKVAFWARIFVGIHLAAVLAALVSWSLLPLVLIGGPRIYGAWHMVMTGLLQHGGLAEDVLDHRLNSRSVLMNPVSQWIYWNMNYHVEHHMFPMVPYHALPKLHELIKDDLPPANPSIAAAYREMLGALWRQRKEPGHFHRKELPPGARPYREELHGEDALPEAG